MPTIQFRQKEPGDWVCIIDETGLSPIAKSILAGFESHLGKLLGRVLGVHEIRPDDRLRLGGMLIEIDERLRSGEPAPEATETDFWPTLIYPLDYAYWCAMVALDLLDKDLGKSIAMHSLSVSYLATFEANMTWLKNLADIDSEQGSGGNKIDPAVIGVLGAAARWNPRNQTKEFALQKYGERKWKSRADGVRKILQDVCEKAREVGFTYAESNIERTIADWIRDSPTSAS